MAANLTLITGRILSGKTTLALAIKALHADTIVADEGTELLSRKSLTKAVATRRPVIVVACDKNILAQLRYPNLPQRHVHIEMPEDAPWLYTPWQ